MNDVRIVLARCAGGGEMFGMRVENVGPGVWALTWAFVVQPATARREGYGEHGEIAGRFEFHPEYPGCPHCASSSFFRCGCGKLACWDGQAPDVTCPWCGRRDRLRGEVDRVSAGRDH